MNSRNRPCPCGSGKRYKHCCGAVAAASPATLPDNGVPPRVRKTFVVLGAPRGGTSLIAGALHHAGVYMGDFRTSQYEDPDFELSPDEAHRAVAQLGEIIRRRNEEHEFWGWKRPNSIYYIRSVVHLLRQPVFLFVYRGIAEIARSSAKHDNRDWGVEGPKLIEVAERHTRMVREFQASLRSPHHAFQLAEIHSDPGAFVSKLVAITQPLPADPARILRFVNPHGGYR
jgi:hypothetical protein